ncbi:CRISPR-associated protein, Cas2 family [Desulfatibacillum alkenivorans DSM 16219]|jgi:CRISPR-associated protein Cas2|uniref:CRISPR-associated endoribonuclease Cas2 n=1 Tax=Desulfatibacillum alkenivorans DSM 16219 TaxID=1121393 RepID=A0A1M6T5U6_9BACT|nr:CRISPR-associated endonuclease Cas2 [Desulfatibacillum alkenivorans]SHK52320.1 CRISPR-associated protein, Cas2 family [Desulfatibacillum alkenivorans DSM 16219]
MFVIMTYDVEAKRTNKFRKLLRKYLSHTQYSVFTGDLPEAALLELRNKIHEIIMPGDRVTEITAENRHNVNVVHLLGQKPKNGAVKGKVLATKDASHKSDYQVL